MRQQSCPLCMREPGPCAFHRDPPPPPPFRSLEEARAAFGFDPLPPKDGQMNDLQRRVFTYLTADGHPQRTTALGHLIERQFFSIMHPHLAREQLKNQVNTWEETNTFCDDGIARFREQFDLPSLKPARRTVRMLIDVEVVEIPGKRKLTASRKDDGGVVDDIVKHISGFRGGCVEVVKSSWRDYVVNPDEECAQTLRQPF